MKVNKSKMSFLELLNFLNKYIIEFVLKTYKKRNYNEQ